MRKGHHDLVEILVVEVERVQLHTIVTVFLQLLQHVVAVSVVFFFSVVFYIGFLVLGLGLGLGLVLRVRLIVLVNALWRTDPCSHLPPHPLCSPQQMAWAVGER